MRAEQIAEIVDADLAAYEAGRNLPTQTLGAPWSDSKRRVSLNALRSSLVTPYIQQFCLKDTTAEMQASCSAVAVYWVVAKSEHFLEFYDPERREYGLAMQSPDGALPQTIGVRGDLVGVFGAI